MLGNESPIIEFRGLFGVPVQVGSSILILILIFVGFGGSAASLPYDLALVAMLVGSIYLHELGHAWGCLVQGVPVRRIVIYGGGGFCEHARSPGQYEQELIVAMGPIVNFTIWALASLAVPYMESWVMIWALSWLALINLFLGLFNLLPVHPLDGGKLFQLLLLRFLPARTATRISGGVGVVFAVLWIPLALWLFFTIGLILFFFPSIRLHMQMLRLSG